MRRNGKKTSRKPSGQKFNYKDKDRLTDTGGLSKADRADERDRRDCFKSKQNDPAWYAQNAQLMADYASFPFGTPLGMTMPPSLGYAGKTAIPGIMAFYYVPTIGAATTETDPINIAARNIYSFVRHANSGHSNYDSPDLMLYLLAMDSIYMFHAYMKRLLGVVLDYTPLNRYYPAALITAMGVDPDDLRAHIADFRGFINQYAVQIGSMCVPNSMSYMARHTWMTEGMYTDSQAGKAQTYMYVPVGYYKFVAIQKDDVAVGSLARVTFFDPGSVTGNGNPATAQLKKVSDIIAFAQDLLKPIITSEDMNIMSGDILKAFGPDGVVKIAGVLDGYMQLPVYTEEVLSQIENMRILNGAVSQSSNPAAGVQQDTAIGGGYLKSTDVWRYRVTTSASVTVPAAAFNALTASKLLNFHHENVAPAEVMVATRLTPGFTYTEQQVTTANPWLTLTLDSAGSEVVVDAYAFYYSDQTLFNNGVQLLQQQIHSARISVFGTSQDAPSLANSVAQEFAILANFDWAPELRTCNLAQSGGATSGLPALFSSLDVDNYTFIDNDNLRNLHTAALLSEFSVPQMGSFNNKL